MITTKLMQEFYKNGVHLGSVANTKTQQWPCGFAWVAIAIQKNGAGHKDLLGTGFRWNAYFKQYELSMGQFTRTRDLTVKEDMAGTLVDILKMNGVEAHLESALE